MKYQAEVCDFRAHKQAFYMYTLNQTRNTTSPPATNSHQAGAVQQSRMKPGVIVVKRSRKTANYMKHHISTPVFNLYQPPLPRVNTPSVPLSEECPQPAVRPEHPSHQEPDVKLHRDDSSMRKAL